MIWRGGGEGEEEGNSEGEKGKREVLCVRCRGLVEVQRCSRV